VNVHLGKVKPNQDKLHVPVLLPDNGNSNGLFKFRTSKTWMTGIRSAKSVCKVPYIDKQGEIHATSICYWRCDATQLYASVTSTVYKRLVGMSRTVPYKKRCARDLLLKIALVYSLENDECWFRRCKAMLGKAKDLRNFVYGFMKRMDQNKRFLFDQAQQVALWFQFRSRLPRRRDRSTIVCANADNFETVAKGLEVSKLEHKLSEIFAKWCSIFRTSYGEINRMTVDSTVRCKSLSVFRG